MGVASGDIFSYSIQGPTSAKPHPHVVIIHLQGSDECIVVPAFGADGFEVNTSINAMKKMGYREDKIFVEMDNSEYVDFADGRSSKRAIWFVARYNRIPRRQLTSSRLIGRMSSEGIKRIIEGILLFAEDHPERFSLNLLKKLRNVLKEV